MNDSVRWLRLYLGLAGAMVFLNVLIVPQAKAAENTPGYALILTLVFATLSVFCGLLMFLAAWLVDRLVRLNPNFVKGVILFRWLLSIFEYGPRAVAGDFLGLSLLLLWTGLSFFMTRMTGRLAEAVKAGAENEVAEKKTP